MSNNGVTFKSGLTVIQNDITWYDFLSVYNLLYHVKIFHVKLKVTHPTNLYIREINRPSTKFYGLSFCCWHYGSRLSSFT